MKKIYIILLIVTSALTGNAQTKSIEGQVLKRLNLFGSDQYTIEAEMVNETDVKYTLKKAGTTEAKRDFISRLNLPADFEAQFKTQLQDLDAIFKTNIPGLTIAGVDLDKRINEEAKFVYSFYVGAMVTAGSLLNQPDAGTIRVNHYITARPISSDGMIRDFKKAANKEFRVQYFYSDLEQKYLLYPSAFKNEAEASNYFERHVPGSKKDHNNNYTNESDDSMKFKTPSKVHRSSYTAFAYDKKSAKKFVRKVLFEDSKARSLVQINQKKDTLCVAQDNLAILAANIGKYESEQAKTSVLISAIRDTVADLTASIQRDKGGLLSQITAQLQTLDTQFPVGKKFENQITASDVFPAAINTELRAFNLITPGDSATTAQKQQSTDRLTALAEKSRKELTALKTAISIDTESIPVPVPPDKPDHIKRLVVSINGQIDKLEKVKARLNRQVGNSQGLSVPLDAAKQKKVSLELKSKGIINALKRELTLQNFVFTVSDVQFEFNEGYIKKIVVFGNFESEIPCSLGGIKIIQSQSIKFVNDRIIAFSTSTDYDDLTKIELESKGKIDVKLSIRLGDLINFYKEDVQVDRMDFSPADQRKTVVFAGNEEFQDHVLKKVATQKLFEARVFTDFLGLSDESNPNGIVQTEAERRFNLNTYRTNAGIGIVEYFTAAGTLSKLDKNNRNLVIGNIDNFENGAYRPIKYASTLGLRQHEIFNFGGDLNLFVWDVVRIKSIFRFEGGFRIGRTSVSDTTRTANASNVVTVNPAPRTFGVTTVRAYPKIVWEIFHDERASITTSFSHVLYHPLTNKFKQLGDADDFVANGLTQRTRTNQYNVWQIMLTFKPQGKLEDKVFLRGTLYTQQDYFKTNFFQFQFGYSFFIAQRLAND